MRIAVLTDLHANVPPLRAILAETRHLGVDLLVHTGDAIDLGPSPAETLDLLVEHRVVCVVGNHDAPLVHGVPPGLPPAEADHYHWTHAQLGVAHRAFVAGWPWRVDLSVGDVHCRFMHYALPARPTHTATVDTNPFLPPPPVSTGAAFDAAFPPPVAGGANLVFHGHTHRPTDVVGLSRHLSPGPAGLGGRGEAPFLLLTLSPGSHTIERYVAAYDPAPLRQALATRPIPDRANIMKLFHAGLAPID